MGTTTIDKHTVQAKYYVQSKGGIMSDVGLNKGQMDYAKVLQVPYFGGMFSILDWKDLVGSRMPSNP